MNDTETGATAPVPRDAAAPRGIGRKSHPADDELKAYLLRCPDVVVFELAHILGDWLGFNGIRHRVPSIASVPSGEREKDALVADIVTAIGYFGSNNLAYWSRRVFKRQAAVGYHDVVFDVAKSLNRQLKKKLHIPRVATVSEREEMICEQLLGIVLQKKSEEEIARILREAGLQNDATTAATVKASVQAGTGGLILVLVKLLGKRAVTALLQATVIEIVAAKVGKATAQRLVLAVFKHVSQKSVAALMNFVGAALIAKDVLDLAGPARRVTIPAVALIAASRMSEGAGNAAAKDGLL